MPDLDDFYAFKSTTGGSGGGGCSGSIFIWILVIIGIIELIGKIFS